jgi:ABC-type antimicrobial peptide transport system permease subunit
VGIIAVLMSVLLLSAAGIHAMMSFTVARRRREIGIRSALGADPRRLLANVFARAGSQLGMGVVAGLAIVVILNQWDDGIMSGRAEILLPVVCLLMLGIGLFAALGPVRRSLAIQPTEALRGD